MSSGFNVQHVAVKTSLSSMKTNHTLGVVSATANIWEELKELNQDAFNALKEEIRNDVAANVKKELLKAFGEIKNK